MEGAEISVEGLRVELLDGGVIVDDVDLRVRLGEVLGLVGESGCGKTATAMALLGYARPGTRINGGRVLVGGFDLLSLRPRELRRLRGRLVSYVPQDPSTALNPERRIGAHLQELLAVHHRSPTSERVTELLEMVQLPSERNFQRRYPHQLSGGSAATRDDSNGTRL